MNLQRVTGDQNHNVDLVIKGHGPEYLRPKIGKTRTPGQRYLEALRRVVGSVLAEIDAAFVANQVNFESAASLIEEY